MSGRRYLTASLCSLAWASWAPQALGQVGAAVGGGIAGGLGASAATGERLPQGLPGDEPTDWRDASTETTSRLTSGCGVVADVGLAVTPRAAYIHVLVGNESREVLAFDPGATLVQLGAGPKRRVRTQPGTHLELQPGWQHWIALELPSKAELRDQSSLTIELRLISPSLGQCVLKSRIERPPGPRRSETFTPYTNVEIAFGAGTRLLTTGAVGELAPDVAFSGSLDFAAYWSLHHGATFDISLDFMGGALAAAVDPGRTFEGNPVVEATGFFVGYAGRLHLNNWLSLVYSPQVGVTAFQLSDAKPGALMTSGVFCPRHRLRLIAPFGSLLTARVFAALSLSHTYVPYGRLGQVDLDGNLMSSLLVLGLGE